MLVAVLLAVLYGKFTVAGVFDSLLLVLVNLASVSLVRKLLGWQATVSLTFVATLVMAELFVGWLAK